MLAAPVAFLALALVMITDNALELGRQLKIDIEQRKRDEAREDFQTAGNKVGSMWAAVRTFASLKKGEPAAVANTDPDRPNSAQRSRSIVNRDTVKVNAWLRTQSQRRRSSTPTGEPRSMSIEDLDLSVRSMMILLVFFPTDHSTVCCYHRAGQVRAK